jgi:catechol-2,3-dioxygenase
MKIRLHEIELGTGTVEDSTRFFQSALGLNSTIKQEGLTVFDVGVKGLDFNLSNHLPPGNFILSFLTDNLEAVQEQLTKTGVSYDGPALSHLGMTSIQFKSPEGLTIKVNTPGQASPAWLKV